MHPGYFDYRSGERVEQIAFSHNCRVAGLLDSQELSQGPAETTSALEYHERRHGALHALRRELAEERKFYQPG